MAQFTNGEGLASIRAKINAIIATVESLGQGDMLLLSAAERAKLADLVATLDLALDGTAWRVTGVTPSEMTAAIEAAKTEARTQAVDEAVAQAAQDAATAISQLVNGSPAALDTLYELATALGNDPDFAATLTAQIGEKLNSSAVSTFGRTLVDDADAEAARTTLALGSAATQASGAFATAEQGAKADSAVQSDPTGISGFSRVTSIYAAETEQARTDWEASGAYDPQALVIVE